MPDAFHLFELLPLELRHRVWELSMEPRRVPVGRFRPVVTGSSPPPRPPRIAPPRIAPPAVLHVCAESRSYLQRYYLRAFAETSPPRYTLINFDMDTVCTRQETVLDLYENFRADFFRIKHLSVDTNDCDYFHDHIVSHCEWLPLLQALEIRPVHEHSTWWLPWDSLMKEWYYRDDAVRFWTTIISPVDHDRFAEINPDNYLQAERHRIRNQYAEMPEQYDSDFEAWDSDDEVCHVGWRHMSACECPSSELWAPRYA